MGWKDIFKKAGETAVQIGLGVPVNGGSINGDKAASSEDRIAHLESMILTLVESLGAVKKELADIKTILRVKGYHNVDAL